MKGHTWWVEVNWVKTIVQPYTLRYSGQLAQLNNWLFLAVNQKITTSHDVAFEPQQKGTSKYQARRIYHSITEVSAIMKQEQNDDNNNNTYTRISIVRTVRGLEQMFELTVVPLNENNIHYLLAYLNDWPNHVFQL